MNGSSLLWQTPSTMDRVVEFIVSGQIPARASHDRSAPLSVAEFLAMEKRPKGTVAIELARCDAYQHEFDGKSVSATDLRKIAENEVRRLSPLKGELETVLARQAEGRPNLIQFLHLRTTTVEAIDLKAQSLGIADVVFVDTASRQSWTPPTLFLTRSREVRLFAISLFALAVGFLILMTGANSWLDRSLREVTRQQDVLRAQVVQRNEAERETGVYGHIAALDPLTRTATGRLSTLSDLTAHTPSDAWWIEAELDGSTVRLTGYSQNAAATLAALANSYPDRIVRFTQAVDPQPDGTEAFHISIDPRTE